MSIKIEPVGYRVLIKPDTVEETTESGIILKLDNPDAERAATVRGTVIGIGPIAWQGDEPWVEIGDRVQYAKFAGKILKDPNDEGDLLVCNDEDILLKIEGEDK